MSPCFLDVWTGTIALKNSFHWFLIAQTQKNWYIACSSLLGLMFVIRMANYLLHPLPYASPFSFTFLSYKHHPKDLTRPCVLFFFFITYIFFINSFASQFAVIYNRGNKCLQKSQFTMFVTPFPPSFNVVIDLVPEKSTLFDTSITLRSVGGDRDYFWPKFLPRY